MAVFLIPYLYLIDLLLFKYFIQGLNKHAGQRGKHCPVFVLTNPGLYLGTGSQAAKTFPRDKAHTKSSGKRDSLLIHLLTITSVYPSCPLARCTSSPVLPADGRCGAEPSAEPQAPWGRTPLGSGERRPWARRSGPPGPPSRLSHLPPPLSLFS